MANWLRKIDVKEYDNITIPPKDPSKKKNWDIKKEKEDYSNSFRITYPELAFYIGLCVMTRCDKWSPEAVAFAKAYFQTIPAIVNGKIIKGDEYLTLNKENENLLRDFSKTTRVGELAQGINYFYFKKYKNVATIYDYKFFCEKKKCKTKGKSPDYVLVYNDGTIGLMESKGITKADPSYSIQSGKEQCINGQSVLKKYVKNGFVSAVNFATSSKRMTRTTRLYIVDPNTDNTHIESNMDEHIRYEYSKLFHYIGEKEIYEALRDNQQITKDMFNRFERKNGEIILQNISLSEMVDNEQKSKAKNTNVNIIETQISDIEIALKQRALEYLLVTNPKNIHELSNISLMDNLIIRTN